MICKSVFSSTSVLDIEYWPLADGQLWYLYNWMDLNNLISQNPVDLLCSLEMLERELIYRFKAKT